MYNSEIPFALGNVFSLIFCCFYIFLILLALASVVLWILMLVDIVGRKDTEFGINSSSDSKTLWIIIILLTGGLGALIYYIMIYKKYPRKY